MGTNWRFSTNKPPYLRNGARYDKGYYWSLIGNRIRAFDWYQNWRPWLTLKWSWTAVTHSVALHSCFSEPTTKIWMKVDPYYQRQKCSPGILVSSNISFMRIFAGVRWRGCVKWEWGGQKCRFSLLSLAISSETSHLRPHLLYCAVCSPLVALQWYRNRWPWMALNGHFALKYVSCSATNGLTFPAFWQNCSKICRATHVLSVIKM